MQQNYFTRLFCITCVLKVKLYCTKNFYHVLWRKYKNFCCNNLSLFVNEHVANWTVNSDFSKSIASRTYLCRRHVELPHARGSLLRLTGSPWRHPRGAGRGASWRDQGCRWDGRHEGGSANDMVKKYLKIICITVCTWKGIYQGQIQESRIEGVQMIMCTAMHIPHRKRIVPYGQGPGPNHGPGSWLLCPAMPYFETFWYKTTFKKIIVDQNLEGAHACCDHAWFCHCLLFIVMLVKHPL